MSTPFPLLCLIIFTKFHNHLISSVTFGKKSKDNFINRKVLLKSTYSFIHSFRAHFPLGRVPGRATLREPNMPHDQQQSQFPWLHTMTGPSKVGDVVRPPGLWTTSGPLSSGCSQQDLPRQSFLEHSGHVAEPTYLGPIDSEK